MRRVWAAKCGAHYRRGLVAGAACVRAPVSPTRASSVNIHSFIRWLHVVFAPCGCERSKEITTQSQRPPTHEREPGRPGEGATEKTEEATKKKLRLHPAGPLSLAAMKRRFPRLYRAVFGDDEAEGKPPPDRCPHPVHVHSHVVTHKCRMCQVQQPLPQQAAAIRSRHRSSTNERRSRRQHPHRHVQSMI